ncbi:hypothetical protein P8452_09232 [Trifolium repens]|nr:hypothetical protein QL285_052599 [Trifolium repens]WJX19558.1 hypothetical protein P8452_09232 [Trifolium repens]
MSLLDHLWDDTVAGPRPENGLGKLRKHPTFPSPSISDKGDGGSVRSYGGDSPEDSMKVTRSIMILKPNGYQSQSESAPASPAAGSTPPLSPFSGKELENPFVFEEGQQQMRMRRARQAKTDQALLLLSMCDK